MKLFSSDEMGCFGRFSITPKHYKNTHKMGYFEKSLFFFYFLAAF